jgi:hypothetical protein
MPGRAAIALAVCAAALAACSRGAPPAAGAPPGAAGGDARAGVDWDHPAALLAMDADEAARRLGSFEWAGTASFTATTQADSSRVHVEERHRVRQAANGEFEADAEIDEGRGPGGEAGKHVVFAGGLTWAHAQFAPWRERPTDHGRDARRFRDESFTMAGDLARLQGAALVLTPAGTAQVLGREARRFTASLSREAAGAAAPPDRREFAAGGPDEETRRHLAFLDGRVPVAAGGEVLFDDRTGVPLRCRLTGAFSLKDDPRVRVQVEVTGEVKALGPKVAAVVPPRGALKDSRKPPGVALALERAGFKTREKAAAAEPADEPEAP